MTRVRAAIALALSACLAGCAAPRAQPPAAPTAKVTPQRAGVIPAERVRNAVAIGKSKADVAAALGEAQVIRFDSGYEVWVYQIAGEVERGAWSLERGKKKVDEEATGEFVVLFAPSGVVTKTRLRPVQKPKTA